jgi:predicted RNA-binding Zn-ribbon protein involved in translation (DUF1610 family)
MEERKLTKEDIDRVRDIEGFPIAKDEDIIALSRPPYYTACPNPFIEDFIREHGTPYNEETDNYHREPFAADVSEGKGDPIYNAHTYHTKVPYRAIMRYILHYTKPGDIVFDGFCGTGMTGVAAQMCGCSDSEYKYQIEQEMPGIEWGTRKAIVNDLSPVATFIAQTYNNEINVDLFQKEAERILDECSNEIGWVYTTEHEHGNNYTYEKRNGEIDKIVWSDVLVCPSCSTEIIFWDAASDKTTGKVKDRFSCPNCGSLLTKRDCSHAQEMVFDSMLNHTITVSKQVPVLVYYSVGRKKFQKAFANSDAEIQDKCKNMVNGLWVPTDELPEGYNTEQPKRSHGLRYVHQFYSHRNLFVLATIYSKIIQSPCKNALLLWFTSQLVNVSKLNRYRPEVSFPYNPLSGTLYIGSMVCESNCLIAYRNKLKRFVTAFQLLGKPEACVSCQSLTHIPNTTSNSIDYIFTDPPFGGNLNYSELSFLWESWLKVKTNNQKEAIINNIQAKGLVEYQNLMNQCFVEYYRVLKPGRWMTVEFHNSKNSVWNAIAEGLMMAGFIVADVRTLDKQQGSFKQVTTATAVKQDLIISAYKPKEAFVRQFTERAGDPEMAWEFVRQHLQNVPIAPDSTGKIEVVTERQDYLLFDRMVAFHIMNGIPVPMDAHTFYAGLRERFIPRDGMFFLPDQVNEYDERRQKMDLQDQQLSLFITDEKSAIIWLNAQLSQVRQSYSEIQPKFLQDWHRNKFEQMPELLDMLKENFLQDEDGKWYVPDLSDKADLEKLRRKRLLKDFYDIYAKGTGRIKNARTEAIRVGFDECWKERNYSLIVKVGDRLPETVLQEDPALLMYYDNAANRM